MIIFCRYFYFPLIFWHYFYWNAQSFRHVASIALCAFEWRPKPARRFRGWAEVILQYVIFRGRHPITEIGRAAQEYRRLARIRSPHAPLNPVEPSDGMYTRRRLSGVNNTLKNHPLAIHYPQIFYFQIYVNQKKKKRKKLKYQTQ